MFSIATNYICTNYYEQHINLTLFHIKLGGRMKLSDKVVQLR